MFQLILLAGWIHIYSMPSTFYFKTNHVVAYLLKNDSMNKFFSNPIIPTLIENYTMITQLEKFSISIRNVVLWLLYLQKSYLQFYLV